MKPTLCQLSLIAAAAAAAPAALAGGAIVKCIDRAGHVTLTDQACAEGSTTVRMVNMPAAEDAAPAAPYPLAAERGSMPPPKLETRRPQPSRTKAKPMQRDVATLKAARAQFLLGDSSARQALAGLE